MIDPLQLLTLIITPTLKELGLWSIPAERLILGTACQESECGRYIKQLNYGVALGIYQIEPVTHDDLWASFLSYRSDVLTRLIVPPNGQKRPAQDMIYDLRYATAMCRIHYLRVKEPIPDNLPAQAAYYKKYYNTPLGKGTEDDYIRSWYRFIGHATF